MLFNSVQFLVFFPIVVIVYYILPHKTRWVFLLIASCYFYMSFIPKYIIILAVTTIVDYLGALLISRYRTNTKVKRFWLVSAIVINLGMLGYFKYFYFFADIITILGKSFHLQTLVLPEIILPIGISFHTFQSLGYLIDVYRGDVPLQKNIGIFALFLFFFPQLVAGPIERSSNLMPQFSEKHYLTYQNLSHGGRMMLWGMLKKVLIADNLAKIVDVVYESPQAYESGLIYIAVFFFAVQIYCDFSGYSDIAIGAAKVMGFRLMKNFDTPYFSTSMTMFWRRWHISLSTWFKDYVYIPLGGNRVSRPRWCLNQLITFSVSGLWHGANLTFLAWGLVHGFAVIGEGLAKKTKIARIWHNGKFTSIKTILSVAYTFVFTSLAWVLFRADSFSDALIVLKKLVQGPFIEISQLLSTISFQNLCVCLFGIVILFVVDFLCRKSDFGIAMSRVIMPARIVIYALLIVLIVLFGAYDNKSFIYFQF